MHNTSNNQQKNDKKDYKEMRKSIYLTFSKNAIINNPIMINLYTNYKYL